MTASTSPASPTPSESPEPSKAPESPKSAKPKSVLQLTWAVVTYQPWLFFGNAVLWTLFHTLPALSLIVVSQVFERLATVTTVTPDGLAFIWGLVALYAVLYLARLGTLIMAFRGFARLFISSVNLLQRNMIAYLLTATGARQLPDTPAEAVSRFRDDTDDVVEYIEYWLDAAGFALFALITLVLMVRIDPLITLLTCAPLFLMIVFVQYMSGAIRVYRRRMREATARVTDFIGETFNAVSVVKLAGREPQMVTHLRNLGETRRKAALKDVLLTQFIESLNTNMVSIAIGLVLFFGAQRVLESSMQVSDFILFITLLPRLTGSMGHFGRMIANHKRTSVNYDRMARLLVDAPSDEIVKHNFLPFGRTSAVTQALQEADIKPEHYASRHAQPPVYQPLQTLEVRELSVIYPSGQGLKNVSFSLQKGEFVVITGQVGSGKSTLLRAVLGLIPTNGGTILWNGQTVQDPASFFVPPHSAYTSQLPNLFSDSLQNNVLTGVPKTSEPAAQSSELQKAIDLAVLRPDLQDLHSGLETPVGTRGVKLSGGQVQRAAVARMLARKADLLVFDDISSALDARTENELWDGLARELEATCLVVSHRKAALNRADRIILLENGELSESGTLSELLERSAVMRALWNEM